MDHEPNSSSPLLFLDDVEYMIPPPPSILDAASAESLTCLRKRAYLRRIQIVNECLPVFEQLWPHGKPVDYFIALDLCGDDPDATCERLVEPAFVRSVLAESRSRTSRSTRPFVDFIESEDNSEDERPKRGRKSKKWKPAEVKLLRNLFATHGPKWKRISRQMKKRTASECQEFAASINLIPESVEPGIRKIKRMISLTFIRGGERFPVGHRKTRFDEAKFLNPLPGVADPVTNIPMTMPAMSPDGYVCDYTTWLKIFAETKVNPFTQLPIRSKRQLVVLTIDNFEEYRDRIVNLDLSSVVVQPQ
jgi:hypothetical protein